MVHFHFTVRATSVDTQNEKRDKHLRNDDFFDVETHPDIQFVSTEVTPAENGWKVSGEMTMLNKTLPLVVEIKKIGEGKDPWGGYRAGIQSEFSIQRSDFGMDYNLTGIGDEVQVFVDIEGKRKSKN